MGPLRARGEGARSPTAWPKGIEPWDAVARRCLRRIRATSSGEQYGDLPYHRSLAPIGAAVRSPAGGHRRDAGRSTQPKELAPFTHLAELLPRKGFSGLHVGGVWLEAGQSTYDCIVPRRQYHPGERPGGG